MRTYLSLEEQQILRRIADDPFFWVRKLAPEIKDWEDEFFDLFDTIKQVWDQYKQNRINIAFALKWNIENVELSNETIQDVLILQKKQNESNSTLIFEIDLAGKVIGEIDIQDEIDPVAINVLSKMREVVVFWLGPDLEIFCRGSAWTPKNKHEILKDIKSRKRNQYLSMEDYRTVLNTHFEQCIRDEARVTYWFKKNEILQPTPEKIFQKSLWQFINDEVDCFAEIEPTFKDRSRCDIKIYLDNYDMYLIEIKWVGYSAVKHDVFVRGDQRTEFGLARAIDGAYQTKRYIEKNNSPKFDNKIKLGIFLVYDAYPKPITPIDYGDEINNFPLMAILEFPLVSYSPSVETKGIAKRKGLV